MDTRIVGGGTRPAVVYVDDHGRMYTYSVQVPLQHWESHIHGQMFLANLIKPSDAFDTVAMTTTGGIVMIIVNNSPTKVMVLSRLLGTVTGGMYFETHRFTTSKLEGLTGDRVITPKNTNFGRSDPTDIAIRGWDGSTGSGVTGVTLDDMSQLANLYAPGATIINLVLGEGWIITPNSSIVIHAKGAGATANMSLLVAGYLHDQEFKS